MATLLQPGRVSPTRKVPDTIERPEYVGKKRPTLGEEDVKDSGTIERMRVAGKIAAQALAEVGRNVKPGVTTDFLDKVGHDFLVDHGAYPSTLGYRGYPKSLCTSLNEVICHGIGTTFHSGLIVPHYDNPDADTVIEPGMTFTIEPMLTLGTVNYDIWPDGWTAVTKDRKRTAQFEHTILVTEDGAEILTLA